MIITPETKEFVKNLSNHPETFENFPLELINGSSLPEGQGIKFILFPIENILDGLYKFTKRQLKHAELILKEVPGILRSYSSGLTEILELAELRYKMCPKILTEEQFW